MDAWHIESERRETEGDAVANLSWLDGGIRCRCKCVTRWIDAAIGHHNKTLNLFRKTLYFDRQFLITAFPIVGYKVGYKSPKTKKGYRPKSVTL